MITFETINELTLKVTSTGHDVLFTKAGAFIGGDNPGEKNYRFEKGCGGTVIFRLRNISVATERCDVFLAKKVPPQSF